MSMSYYEFLGIFKVNLKVTKCGSITITKLAKFRKLSFNFVTRESLSERTIHGNRGPRSLIKRKGVR